MQQEIQQQIDDCYKKYGQYASAHEAFAVLQEEIDELWEIVKQKPSERDYNKMHKEIKDCIVVLHKMNNDIVKEENRR